MRKRLPRGKSPMKLLTPRELKQTAEVQVPTGPGRVTIPDPSDTLSDLLPERTMKQLVESAVDALPTGVCHVPR